MKRLNLTLFLALSVLLLFAAGCGKKARPTVPKSQAPIPVQIVEAKSTYRGVEIEFNHLSKTESGLDINDMLGFNIYRATSQQEICDCKEIPFYKLFIPLDMNSARFVDTEVEPGNFYTYQISAQRKKKGEGRKSPQITKFWDKAAVSPGNITAEPTDRAVKLAWSPVVNAYGYNVYLKGEKLSLLNKEPILENKFIHKGQNGVKYEYAVTSLLLSSNELIESAFSSPVSATPEDILKPAKPKGFRTVRSGNTVFIRWEANEEDDLLGYNIYRRIKGEGEIKRLNSKPLDSITFEDILDENKNTYEYWITAVDTSKNESMPSDLEVIKPLD